MQAGTNRCPELSPEQRETYWRKGYIAVRSVLGGQNIDHLRQECERLSSLPDSFDPFVPPRKTLDGREVRERLDAVTERSPAFRALAHDDRLVGLVRQLLGGDALLFKGSVNLRPPGTRGFLLHQDYATYGFTGVTADDLITAMVPLDPVTKASGPVECFSGYHHDLLPEAANDPGAADPNSIDASRGEAIELAPGDVFLFHSLTPHRSTPNLSDRPRRVAFLTYNHARHGDCYRRYYTGREAFYRQRAERPVAPPPSLAPVPLVGERIELATLQAGHVDALYEAGKDARVWQYMTRRVRSHSEMADWVNEALERRDTGTEMPFVIREPSTDRIIGETRLIAYSAQHRQVETAWTWVTPSLWGRGYYTDVMFLLMSHCFETLRLVRVESTADTRNIRGRRARERFGAKLEGILRKHRIMPDGYLRDSAYYSVVVDEWPEVKQRMIALIKEKLKA